MNNININTDTLRRALDGDEEAIKEAQSLLPTPRTLADMAPVERAECEWMQCDHHALEEPGVILHIWGNGCHVLSREGVVEAEALNHVTPRPDLPRMQWPGNEPEDDVAAATGGELTTQDVVDECRAVRKERATPEPAAPRPEDVPVSEPWLLEVDGRKAIGFRNYPEDRFCWTVVYRDIESTDQLRDDEVTLVARLVSETTEQDDEPVFDPDLMPPSGSEDRSPWWFYLGDQIVGTSGSGDIGIQHTVVVHDEDGSPVHSERWIDLTPKDARHLAAILLTAAVHATQEKE